ncbi:SDR family oxidoreductase [Candidatus Pacearchaeota archaeon]|nr:SDR family oxidoreductase [Candidatus Pacearchaeota archaeon]
MRELTKKDTILITGGSGLLGSNLAVFLGDKFNVYFLYNKNFVKLPNCEGIKIDLTNFEETKKLILKVKPKIIIHCAALTNVDYCEEKPHEAELINSQTTKNLAEISKQINSKLIYISTDSVFDGEKGDYSEEDKPNPINVYGKTKLNGENYVKSICKNYTIIRTNIYGWNIRDKFSLAEWILNKLKKNETFFGFEDIQFTPLLVNNLGRIIFEICIKDIKGLYHIAGPEKCSKFDFAKIIAEVFCLNKDVIKLGNSDLVNFKAPRPKNISLDTEKIQNILKTNLFGVRRGLEEFKFLNEKGFVKMLKKGAEI